MEKTIRISKDNDVSIGSHPSYLDRENFGRRRMNISPEEVTKLIIDQCEILSKAADKLKMKGDPINVTNIGKTFEDEAKKVNENNFDWWYSRETQKARKLFCDEFAISDRNVFKTWIKFILG